MSEAIAEPPKPTTPPVPTSSPATPASTVTEQPKEDVSARAFMSMFARDIGVQLGEPDLKKIEQPKQPDMAGMSGKPTTTPDKVVESIEGVPISELAKRRREATEAVPKPSEPPKPAAASPTAHPAPDPKATPNVPPSVTTHVPKSTPNVPQQPTDVPQTPAKPEVPDIEATLLPEEREELEFDRLAERLLPDKKGMAAKRLKFFESLNKYVEDNPDAREDEVKSFVAKHKPTYTDAERRKIDRMAVKEEVLAEAKKAVEQPLAEAQKRIRELETQPKINQKVEEFEVDLTAALPEDLRKAALEKDLDELDADFPLEAPIARMVYDNTLIAANEFLALASGVKEFDAEHGTHQWLLKFINTQGDIFNEHGGDARVRGGRKFVPRGTYTGDPKTWTFSDDDILKMLTANAKTNIETMIANEASRVEKISSKRRPAARSENSTPEPPSPRMPTTPSPGAATTNGNEQPLAGFFRSLVGDQKPS